MGSGYGLSYTAVLWESWVTHWTCVDNDWQHLRINHWPCVLYCHWISMEHYVVLKLALLVLYKHYHYCGLNMWWSGYSHTCIYSIGIFFVFISKDNILSWLEKNPREFVTRYLKDFKNNYKVFFNFFLRRIILTRTRNAGTGMLTEWLIQHHVR